MTTNHLTAPSWHQHPCPVTMDGELLDLTGSLAVWNHSPDGFAWGYGGSGPAQLALAILLRVTDQTEAVANYQAFKWAHVAGWPMDEPLDVHVDVTAWLVSQDLTDF